jgi:peptide/nickel transport system substrate-binding protein
MTQRGLRIITGLCGLALALAACGPSAAPTATTQANPTATTATQPTATTQAATAPAGATATSAEVKVRPIPVLNMPPQNPLAQKGGTFRHLQSVDNADYASWEAADFSIFQVANPIMDTLLDRNEFEAGKNDQILGNLAYDWWTDQAGTTWTFKLQQNAKFHDGKPFTCADAEFSLETIRDAHDSTGATLRRSPRGRFLLRVKAVKCADDTTLQVTTDGPLPSLPATLAISSFAMMPKHVFEGHLDLMPKQAWPGVGPWLFEDKRPTEYFHTKRNPNYWNQPYPYMDAYQVSYLGSNTAVTAAFRVGRGEGMGTNLTPTQRQEMIDQGKAWQPVTGVADGFTGYQANWTRSPWNDPRFSLAMRCAIDTAEIIATASNGDGYEGPVFPLASDPGGSEWAITMEEWKAVHPCHGPSGDAANMEKRRQIARDLMAQMGFTAQNPAKPTSYYVNPDQVFTVVVTQLAKVNIQVQSEAVSLDTRYNIQTNAERDILQQGFVTSRRDPDHWLYEQYYSTSDRNYGRYGNPEVDALINQQSRTLDPVERKKLVNQIEKLLLKDNAKIVTRHSNNTRLLAIWVKDAYWGEPSNGQNSTIKYVRVWLDQAKMKEVMGG